MKSNQKRHIELLKRSEDLKNQGKDIFTENKEEYFELAGYNVAVEEYFFWQDRDQFALLLKNFLNKKIDGEFLCDEVFGMRRKLMIKCDKFKLELLSNSEKIQDFQPDERSKDFGGFLSRIYFNCDYFMEDYQNEKFYDSVKNNFLDFQKALDEE